MFLLVLVAQAHAVGPDAKLTVQSLPEWWAMPGRPGFVDDAHMGNGLAFRYLGLTAGGVGLDDDLLPAFRPWPGIGEIAPPMAWYDSVAVVIGEGGAWNGFGAPLVRLQAISAIPSEKKPRAAFTLVNGSSSMDRNGLMLQRGSAESWMRGGALSENRAGTGLLEQSGQHAWFLELGRHRGAHTFSASFSQRGAAGGTHRDRAALVTFLPPPFVGLEETAHGEGGALSWDWHREDRHASVRVERSHDHRESFESELFDLFAEREAQEDGVVADWGEGGPSHTRGLRLETRTAEVRRSDDALGDLSGVRPARAQRDRSLWLAARAERPLLGGQLELALGAGYASAPEPSQARVQAAPSLVWRAGDASRRVRVVTERLVQPVWGDLSPGLEPFVQDTWLALVDAGLGDRARQWLDLSLLGADIGNRAQLQPWPVRDIALRYGWTHDEGHVQDGIATLALGLRRGAHALEASAFTRVRPEGSQSGQQDPAVGGRVGAETGFRAFAGDLGVTLRLDAGWVGARDNFSLPEYFVRPRPVDGYATYDGSLALTLGDARIVLRATNLEDRPHTQTWTDPLSTFPGTPAVGAGRQLRAELAWPFFN